MSLVIFMIGVFGSAGCIETDRNPALAIVILIIGLIMLIHDTKRNCQEYRDDTRLRFLP